jgi:hypothetical protein
MPKLEPEVASAIARTKVDKATEQCVAKLIPGGRAVWVRIDDGPPQRAIVCRTDVPFPPLVRELRSPEGKTFKIEAVCSNDGYVFFTWGEVK